MTNKELIRQLIKGSIQRAVQESVAAIIVMIGFAAILAHSEVGSPKYCGCLVILVSSGFIVGVVWSHSLSYQLLSSHSPEDLGFWRAAFRAQAKLLRWVPLWYCVPIGAGALLFVAPTYPAELLPFLLLASFFAAVLTGVTILNRGVASKIEEMESQLTGS